MVEDPHGRTTYIWVIVSVIAATIILTGFVGVEGSVQQSLWLKEEVE
jgi:hypothetical protein